MYGIWSLSFNRYRWYWLSSFAACNIYFYLGLILDSISCMQFFLADTSWIWHLKHLGQPKPKIFILFLLSHPYAMAPLGIPWLYSGFDINYLASTVLWNCKWKTHGPLNLAYFFSLKKKKKYHMGNIVNFCTQLEIAPGHLDLSCRRFWIQHSHNLEAHPSGVLPSQHISCCSCPDHTASLQQIQTLFQHKIEVLSFLVMFAFLYTFKISSYQICCPNNHATDSTLWCVKI